MNPTSEITTAVETLRASAREAVSEFAREAAERSHQRNYHKLHVWRDGSVSWTESLNSTDDIIDRGAKHFAAVKSVISVGTGSYLCNCDFCEDKGFDSREEAICAAVDESDLSDLEAEMLKKFDAIPIGYFDDEPESHSYEVLAAHVEPDHVGEYSGAVVVDLRRDDGVEGDIWVAAGVPDHLVGTAKASGHTYRMKDVWAWGATHDDWCPSQFDYRDMTAMLDAARKVALKTWTEFVQQRESAD